MSTGETVAAAEAGSRRLLVIVLDAANPALLRSWAADGSLPNIASLLSTGLVADTRSDPALYVGASWPSFYTGVSPGGHGIYWIDQVAAGTYRNRTLGESDFAVRRTLWETLGEAGHRTLVLDVPVARLSPGLHGVQVLEWGTHDGLFGFRTTPPELAREILEEVGPHPVPSSCDAPRRSRADYRTFADCLIRGAALRARLAVRLLASEQWDFAIQVFSETHCAGHQLWHFHDPSHPAFDTGDRLQCGDLLRQVYIGVDTALGDILGKVGPDTMVAVATLHGMSHTAGSSRILGDILLKLGATTLPSLDPPPGATTWRDRMVHRLRVAYRRIPESIRQPLYDMRSRLNQRMLDRGAPIRIDPRRTKCFQVETGPLVGGIRLNLAGREPQGTLARGEEADRFCATLAEQLLEIVDPATGRGLVRRVLRTADHYQGDCIDMLPDLLVEWDLDTPLGSAVVGSGGGAMIRGQSARIGLIEKSNEYGRTGEHRVEGLCIVRGPGVQPGSLGRVISNLDLAPTFARMLGCEMPGVEGAPVPELLGG